jgi:UPF0755 protein
MHLRIVIALGIILVLGGLVVAAVIVRAGSPGLAAVSIIEATFGQPASEDPRPVHVVVHPGESAGEVGTQLASEGLIRNSTAFRLSARFGGVEARLEAGDYELRRNMPLAEVLATLAQGRMVGGFFTVPEGWRALETADALERSQVTSRASFLDLVEHPTGNIPDLLNSLPKGQTLEGYLYPDSYRFDPSTPADVVLRQMLDTFASRVTPDLRAGFQANGLSLQQAVTLASIVEREAVVADERPIIASVYLNRLRRGMRLQADPTVQYALVVADGVTTGTDSYWKRRLTFADLAISSPYNTYQVVGLPPGPICSPGLASLRAVAFPATTDYLYFVARSDGTHAFARTLEEHQQNVTKYQS